MNVESVLNAVFDKCYLHLCFQQVLAFEKNLRLLKQKFKSATQLNRSSVAHETKNTAEIPKFLNPHCEQTILQREGGGVLPQSICLSIRIKTIWSREPLVAACQGFCRKSDQNNDFAKKKISFRPHQNFQMELFILSKINRFQQKNV